MMLINSPSFGDGAAPVLYGSLRSTMTHIHRLRKEYI